MPYQLTDEAIDFVFAISQIGISTIQIGNITDRNFYNTDR
jgi:hypothetical protein